MPYEHTGNKETQEYLKKNYYHRIKYVAATFLTTFIWKKPQNNIALAIMTHRESKKVSNVIGTQVRA